MHAHRSTSPPATLTHDDVGSLCRYYYHVREGLDYLWAEGGLHQDLGIDFAVRKEGDLFGYARHVFEFRRWNTTTCLRPRRPSEKAKRIHAFDFAAHTSVAILACANDEIPLAYIRAGSYVARLAEKLLLVSDDRDRSGESLSGDCLGAIFLSLQPDNRWGQLHGHVHLIVLALAKSRDGEYRAAEVGLICESLSDLRACFLGALAYVVDSEMGYEVEYLDRDFRVRGVPDELIRQHTSPLVEDPDAVRPPKPTLTREWLEATFASIEATDGHALRNLKSAADRRKMCPRPKIPAAWVEREINRALTEKPILSLVALVAHILWTWPGQIDPEKVLSLCTSKTASVSVGMPALRCTAETGGAFHDLGGIVRQASIERCEKTLGEVLERAPLLRGLLGSHLRESTAGGHLVQVTDDQGYWLRLRAAEAQESQGVEPRQDGVYRPAPGLTMVDLDATLPTEAAVQASAAVARGDRIVLFGAAPSKGLPRETTPLGAAESYAMVARTLLSRPPTQPSMFFRPRELRGDIRHAPKRSSPEVEQESDLDLGDPVVAAGSGTAGWGVRAAEPGPARVPAAAIDAPSCPDDPGEHEIREPQSRERSAEIDTPVQPDVEPSNAANDVPGSPAHGPGTEAGNDVLEPGSRAEPNPATPPACVGAGSSDLARSLESLDDDEPVSLDDLLRRIVRQPTEHPDPRAAPKVPWSIAPERLKELIAERNGLPASLVTVRREGIVVRRPLGDVPAEFFIDWAQSLGHSAVRLTAKSGVSPSRRLGVSPVGSGFSAVEHWVDARECRGEQDLDEVLEEASRIQGLVDTFIDSSIRPEDVPEAEYAVVAPLLRDVLREVAERQVSLTCRSPSSTTLSMPMGRGQEPVTVAALDVAILRWGPRMDAVDLDDLKSLRVREREDGQYVVECELSVDDRCLDRARSRAELLVKVCAAAPDLFQAAARDVTRLAQVFTAKGRDLSPSCYVHRPDEGGVRMLAFLEEQPGAGGAGMVQACVDMLTSGGAKGARVLTDAEPLCAGEIGVGVHSDGRMALQAWFTDEWLEATTAESQTDALAYIGKLTTGLRMTVQGPGAEKSMTAQMPL